MMQPLQGSFVALVTPMCSDGSLDYESLESLIEWHIQSGTNGIVTVGTTGESATVSVEEHLQIIDKTIQFVDGRIPVIAGTGANSTQEALELTQTAAVAWCRLCFNSYSLLQQTESRRALSALYEDC